MKKPKLNSEKYQHAQILNKAQLKKIMGGTEVPPDEDDTLCRECLQDSDCDGGRKCYRVDNKFCADGLNKTRCILPMFE